MRWLGSQEGSVSPVFITLFLVTILLMMVFLDREWVNYTYLLTEQTADFAAEAGGAEHEGVATVRVQTRQYIRTWETVCDEKDATGTCLASHPEPVITVNPGQVPLTDVPEQDLKDHWTELANCRRAQPQEMVMAPDWECVSVEIVERHLTFTAHAEPIALRTFMENWQDRGSARLVSLDVTYDGQTPEPAWAQAYGPVHRSVIVVPVLRVKSLFGLAWERTVTIPGRSVTQLDDLVLK